MKRLFVYLMSLMLLIPACRPGANTPLPGQVEPTSPPDTPVTVPTATPVLPTPAPPTPSQAGTPASPPPAPAAPVVIPIGGVNETNPVVKPLLGVVSGPDQPVDSPAPNLTAHFHDIGVLTVRNNDYFDDRMDIEGIFNCGGPTYPSWEGCDPMGEANYHWESSDALFESWLAGGFEPFLRLGGEVQNATRRHDFKGPQNAVQEENWIQATQKVVDRYLHRGGQAQTFTYLDIWTEFPNESFWDSGNMAFFRFWTQAFVTLKAAYPELKIGGPGFVASQAVKVAAGEKSAAQEFLAYLYQNGVKPDWIGWHLFYNDPLMWYQAAQSYRDLLDGQGLYADVPWAGSGFFDDVELIVDAYGVAKMGLTPQERDQVYNHQKGAAIRTASWIAMQYSDVERAYLYRSGDPHSSPGDDLASINRGNYTGLFYGDAQATYKPSAHAFRLWSQVVNRFPTLLTTPLPPSDATGGLWALAAQNEQGQIAVLISNVTAKDVAWYLSFASTTIEDYQIEIYRVDDEQDGRAAQAWPGGAATIPAESVQLIVLTPDQPGSTAASEPTSLPKLTSTPETAVSAPTLDTCRAWLQTTHTLDYPSHGCAEHTDVLNGVEGQGGGVIPLDDKFFIARFPDGWDQLPNRKLIVTLHGSGGCSERLYRWWDRPAAEHQYALVALQYASEDAAGEMVFDDSNQIYANLRAMFDKLQPYCPLDDTSIVYHGFSKGSARSFEIALLDRASDGAQLFSTFISDSGTGFPDYEGQMPPMLQAAAPDAYSGGHFWLYCGEQDHEGRTCRGMAQMEQFILTHGGTVDTLYKYPPGGHGIFSTVKPDGPGKALTTLFEYIDTFEGER